MNINIANIPDEGLKLRISKNRDWFHEMLPEKDAISFAVDGIDVTCSVTRIGKTVSVTMRIETAISLECCRCLTNYTVPLHSESRYTFVPAEHRSTREEIALTDEDLGFAYYTEEVIDLDPIILEQIVLQIPMKPLCKETCKGLCPVCGIDRNRARCDHRGETFEGPFAVLKNLKIGTYSK